MSAPLINRSLTTIRTELEFLHDSEVITDELFNKLNDALPNKYQKDMKAWGVEKIQADSSKAGDSGISSSTDKLAQELQSTKISTPVSESASVSSHHSKPAPAPPSGPKALSYCKVLFDFQAQEADDLNIKKDEKIGVIEHLSEDWWKGYKRDEPNKSGIFPSNYVKPISDQEFNAYGHSSEKAEYNASTQYNSYQPPAQPGYGQYQSPPAYGQQPQSTGSSADYSQFPPPSTNYYSSQQQQQQQGYPQQGEVPTDENGQPQHQVHPHLRKFGSKLGNAAIFGAGATIGSDIVNSIF